MKSSASNRAWFWGSWLFFLCYVGESASPGTKRLVRRGNTVQGHRMLAGPSGYMESCVSDVQCQVGLSCNLKVDGGTCDYYSAGDQWSLCEQAIDCENIYETNHVSYCNRDVQGDCGSGVDCGVCNFKNDGEFEAACNSTFDCPSDTICTASSSVTAPIKQCLRIPGEGCIMSKECASGICSTGLCAAMPDGAACRDDSDCSSSFCHADSQICQPLLTDCAEKPRMGHSYCDAIYSSTFCQGGSCNNKLATGDTGCSGFGPTACAGQCTVMTNQCKCLDDTHCPSPDQFCAADGSCVDLYRTGRECSNNGHCASGNCSDTALKCVCSQDSNCASNEFCSPFGDCKPKRPYKATCSRDDECFDGFCFGYRCSKLCSHDQDCGSGFGCDLSSLPVMSNSVGYCYEQEACIPDPEQGEICGVISPTNCEKALMEALSTSWSRSRRLNKRTGPGLMGESTSSLRNSSRKLGTVAYQTASSTKYHTDYKIKVRVHILKKNDGSGGLSENKVIELIDVANEGFANTPFFFNYQDGKTRIVYKDAKDYDPSWHYFTPSNSNTLKSNLRRGNKKTVNIYLGDPSALGVLGISTFPHTLVTTDGESRDGIMLKNPSLADNDDEKEEIQQTLIHELGHWLGLLHTFEGTTCTSNDLAGDGVADTNAQSCPGWDNGGWETCFVNKNNPVDSCDKLDGTCSSKDYEGCDPVWNYMDYAHHSCMKTYGHFTDGQIGRMVAMHEIFRNENYDYDYRRRRELELSSVRGSGGRRDSEVVQACAGAFSTECNCERECVNNVLWPLFALSGLEDNFIPQVDTCNRCQKDSECATDEICAMHENFYGRRCLPRYENTERAVACETNSQCMSGYCEPERCSSPPCTRYCHAGPGDACDPGSVPTVCAKGYTCDATSKTCVEVVPGSGAVNATCVRDQDCLSNRCSNLNPVGFGKCLSCTWDNECDDTRFCSAGSCVLKGGVKASCDGDNHCLTGSCIGSTCLECQEHDDCGLNKWCTGGHCVECETDRDCPDPQAQYCRQKTCLAKKSAEIGIQCYANNECLSGHCVATPGDPTGRMECRYPCDGSNEEEACTAGTFTDCVLSKPTDTQAYCQPASGDEPLVNRTSIPEFPIYVPTCDNQAQCAASKAFPIAHCGAADVGLCVKVCLTDDDCRAPFTKCSTGPNKRCLIECETDSDCPPHLGISNTCRVDSSSGEKNCVKGDPE